MINIILFSISLIASQGLIFFQNNTESLDPKELIRVHFKPYKFVGAEKAYYKKDNEIYEVNFEKSEEYKEGIDTYTLVFFSSYQYDEERGRNTSHAASGIVSVAKYKYKNEKWELVIFNDECDCGYGEWGDVNIPNLKQYGEYYFFESERLTVHQGYVKTYLSICNTENFKESIRLISSASNEGSEPMPGTEQNYDSKVIFETVDNQFIMKVKFQGIDYDYKNNKRINMNKTEVYHFNEKTLTFQK